MEIDPKLSMVASAINHLIKNRHLEPEEELFLLLQFTIKIFFEHYEDEKDVFMEMVGEVYDSLQEEGNRLGVL